MQSEFVRDLVDPDQPIKDAVDERPGKPLKIRVQPMIFRSRTGKNSSYQSWPQVSWTLDCDSADEAFALRDTMEVFFAVMGRCGPQAVQAALAQLRKESAA